MNGSWRGIGLQQRYIELTVDELISIKHDLLNGTVFRIDNTIIPHPIGAMICVPTKKRLDSNKMAYHWITNNTRRQLLSCIKNDMNDDDIITIKINHS